MRIASIAASITTVPLPQNGSISPSARTRASFAITAASVSLMGASFEFLL